MKKMILTVMAVLFTTSVFATVDDVIKQLLPDSDLKPRALILRDGDIQKVKNALGEMTPVKGVFAIYKSKTGAVVLEEQYGNHGIIEIAVLIDGETKKVKDVVILSMRERKGQAVKKHLFMKQFIGKSVHDPVTLGEDIRAVTGATISSRAVTIAVKRALVIYDIFLAKKL